jgi:hypothetical protein
MQLLLCILLLISVGSCVPEGGGPLTGEGQGDIEEEITIFLTGNELGSLKPCGCSGGQLGGLERRTAIFDSVSSIRRMIVGTGNLVQGPGEQSKIKFEIFIEAFGLLGYDAVNLSAGDMEIAELVGALESPRIGFISSIGGGERMAGGTTREYSLDYKPILVKVVSFDDESGSVSDIGKFWESELPIVRIVIANNCDEQLLGQIRDKDYADCVICPAGSDEAELLSECNQMPLVVTTGRYGRHVAKIVIKRADNERGFTLEFCQVDVDESLKDDPNLVELYKSYQQWVKDAELLAKHPKYPLDDGLSYVGSDSCKEVCHSKIYDKWSSLAHADAYATLVDVNSQFDRECVVCHVVGLDYESGFLTEEQTPKMKDVGCENCHGPGSKHIENPLEFKTGDPKSACEDCHTPEHSAEFGSKRDEYMKKIKHWRELKPSSNVK